MLEGVLKDYTTPVMARILSVSILGMLEGVLKVSTDTKFDLAYTKFQSLVCWRGC